MICLDTNAAIAVLNGRPPAVRTRLAAALAAGEEVAIFAAVLFELRYGVARSARPKENAERVATLLSGPVAILPFAAEDADEAGALRAVLERAGTPIGPFDLLIAAQARRRGATIVTANAREFARVPGLKRLDWAA